MSLILERDELFDIFNDSAFSSFVDRYLTSTFTEEWYDRTQREYQSPSPTPNVASFDMSSPSPSELNVHRPLARYDSPPQEAPKSTTSKPMLRRTPIKKHAKLQQQPHTVYPLQRTKRNKLIWTPSLHKQFLKALDVLGTFDAMPADVLYVMNVEGLTRENVASHLQKHRQRLVTTTATTRDETPTER